jgi:DNA-binding transcriptional LysR family regulator
MHGVHELAGVDLNLVVALDALLAERHVTRAASRLGLTQSATSHALARLRGLFKDSLLVRGSSGTMVPTPLAEWLAPQVRRALDDLATTLRGEVFDPATVRRSFHIGASDMVELVLLPALMARIAAIAPHVDVWVHTYPEWGDAELASGALDVVVGPGYGTAQRKGARPAGGYEQPLFVDEFTCVMRKKHPLADGRLTLARYCAASHLLVAPRGAPGSLVDTALAELGRSRRVALAVPHFLVVPHIVATTDLVATLATRVARIFAGALDLVLMSPPIEMPKIQMVVGWHERNQRDPAHVWLRKQLHAAAAAVR